MWPPGCTARGRGQGLSGQGGQPDTAPELRAMVGGNRGGGEAGRQTSAPMPGTQRKPEQKM